MDPQTGRFVSEDPYTGSVEEPISLHRFIYANVSPLLFQDPTGRASVLPWRLPFLRRFLPTNWQTPWGFGTMAHDKIVEDIRKGNPQSLVEGPWATISKPTGGAVYADLIVDNSELYEIKPLGLELVAVGEALWYVSKTWQPGSNRLPLTMGMTVYQGLVSVNDYINIEYHWTGPGAIAYEPLPTGKAVGTIVNTIICAQAISMVAEMLNSVVWGPAAFGI